MLDLNETISVVFNYQVKYLEEGDNTLVQRL